MEKTRTVLVTGATGFIGRATVDGLTRANWKTVKASRSAGTSPAEGSVKLDLAEPATLLAMSEKSRFDAIVHLGAQVGLADETESELYAPNVLFTGCLANLARIWDAHMIFASTAIVHGARTEKIQADSPLCLDTTYAKSKWLAEQLIAASGARHCILRIAGAFGSNGPTHLGLNRAIDAAGKGITPLVIGSGKALRNYIYVKDVAEAIVYALREGIEGTHLLAGHEVLSIGEMMHEICDTFLPGRHPAIKDGPEASNQMITPSAFLPVTRGFRDALADMRGLD